MLLRISNNGISLSKMSLATNCLFCKNIYYLILLNTWVCRNPKKRRLEHPEKRIFLVLSIHKRCKLNIVVKGNLMLGWNSYNLKSPRNEANQSHKFQLLIFEKLYSQIKCLPIDKLPLYVNFLSDYSTLVNLGNKSKFRIVFMTN